MLFPLILLGLTACSSRAQDLEIDCSDPGLSAYLLSLVDTLYTAGLTTYEQLIAHIILTDDGYDLLSDLYYSDQNFTLLIPTNDAFGSTGIYGTWDQMSFPSFLPSDDDAVNLVAFHILQGFQGYDQLPVVPLHGVASTALKMNCSGATEEWQVQVMEKDPSGDGSIELRMASGNGSSWTSPLSVDQSVLGNLMLLPINMVLPFPPNLGSALAMSTSSRSQQGLGTLSSALNASTSGFNPSEIGPAGLTIFAPVNDAWTNQSVGQLEDPTTGPELMGNHYMLNYSLYSPMWVGPDKLVIKMESGVNLTMSWNGSSSYVTLGSQKATILRSDIALSNGVMHIIDTVLLESTTSSPSVVSSLDSSIVMATATATAVATASSGGTAQQPMGSSSGAMGRPLGVWRGATGLIGAFIGLAVF